MEALYAPNGIQRARSIIFVPARRPDAHSAAPDPLIHELGKRQRSGAAASSHAARPAAPLPAATALRAPAGRSLYPISRLQLKWLKAIAVRTVARATSAFPGGKLRLRPLLRANKTAAARRKELFFPFPEESIFLAALASSSRALLRRSALASGTSATPAS